MRKGRIARIGAAAMARAIATAGYDDKIHSSDGAQHMVMIGDPVADDVDTSPSFCSRPRIAIMDADMTCRR